MQSIISKGKNLQEAIDVGLKLLEASKNEVNIEVIQQESKSFFKMKSKEAIVKITKLEQTTISEQNHEESTDPFKLIDELLTNSQNVMDDPVSNSVMEEESAPRRITKKADDLLGKAWVENGRLVCRCSPTHYPLVSIPDGVNVYKNNQLITEKSFVMTETDLFEVKMEMEEKETVWRVVMDAHKLNVDLHIEPGYKTTRFLLDIAPAQHIELLVDEKKEVSNTLSYQDIMGRLEELRIKHGFHQNEIIRAIEAVEPGVYTIATGIEAAPGKDGWIEFQINMDAQIGPREIENGRVDYRETKTIPNVNSGSVIAIVHPPVPGQPGRTVTNEPLPAKQTIPISVKSGKGIAIIDDKIIALESGRPHVEQRRNIVKVSIMSKLTHPGNVDLSSGNIHFMGDVEVLGEVCERMKIDAEGNILVHQTVNMANLTASGAVITYGSIIGSEVSAGKNNMLVTELGQLLGPINQDLVRVIQLIKQLTLSPGFKASDFSRGGLQPLINILLEKKFKQFPSLVREYVDKVKKGEQYLSDKIWSETANSLSKLFLSLSSEAISVDSITELSEKMQELHELSKMPVEPNSYITVPNVLSSRLYCSGDVNVFDQGSVNTKIYSGGKLTINGSLRGGEVFGRFGAEINEAGAESRTPTIVAVPEDQKISINKVMEGTAIKIGNAQYKFNETRSRVHAYLNKHGQIAFE
ncbi:flagellar assembly protein A [Domibacillus epiphyticus]|uniref:RNA-binding protein KhpB N-terminal domain-containing protein n=1 Tax=Domibacillus epiphyticus TaxID=1714355 RepID=A0A1V2A9I7_9BACI|nr:FapA family protein [Domibacillus epiphyticus]OMP67512.1 hypothetical protein BTO28_06070 [Domibacillus epiphyticus]